MKLNPKFLSLIALAVAVLGIFFLLEKNHIVSSNPIAIAIQICAAGLMLWARITFGLRSFHAAANTTKGELVTRGPYRWFRHPIYASLIYFFSASLIAYPSIKTVAAVMLIYVGLFMRMLLEEKYLLEEYSEYVSYAKRTKRIVPFLF